jgi:hypothetical protein
MVLPTRTPTHLLDPSVTQVDPVAPHRDSLSDQELALPSSFRHAPIGSDDAMPWQVIVGVRKNVPHESRCTRFDVPIGADKPFGDGAHPADDARSARLELGFYARPRHASISLTLVPTRSTEFE